MTDGICDDVLDVVEDIAGKTVIKLTQCRRPSGPKPEIQHDRRGRGMPALT